MLISAVVGTPTPSNTFDLASGMQAWVKGLDVTEWLVEQAQSPVLPILSIGTTIEINFLHTILGTGLHLIQIIGKNRLLGSTIGSIQLETENGDIKLVAGTRDLITVSRIR